MSIQWVCSCSDSRTLLPQDGLEKGVLNPHERPNRVSPLCLAIAQNKRHRRATAPHNTPTTQAPSLPEGPRLTPPRTAAAGRVMHTTHQMHPVACWDPLVPACHSSEHPAMAQPPCSPLAAAQPARPACHMPLGCTACTCLSHGVRTTCTHSSHRCRHGLDRNGAVVTRVPMCQSGTHPHTTHMHDSMPHSNASGH